MQPEINRPSCALIPRPGCIPSTFAEKMKRLLKNLLIFFGVLCIVGALAFFTFWPDKPLDEIMGLSQSSFEEEASGGLPESASRIMRYTTGFEDWSRWVSYSADKSDIEKAVRELTEKKIEELELWEKGAPCPIDRPARPEKRNEGYWDVQNVIEGRSYYLFDGSKGIGILVDTKRWRIYIHEWTT